MLEITDLSFRSLNYPNFRIEKGNTTFICGDEGCGKSTLLKLLNGSLKAEKGIIKFKGKDIKEIEKSEYKKQVILISKDVEFKGKTIKDNLMGYISKYDLKIENEIKKYLSFLKLDVTMETKINNLSKEEKYRLAIAFALYIKPEVLLLDEPTLLMNSLTLDVVDNIKNYSLETGMALVIVSKNRELIELYSDRILIFGSEE